MPYATASRSHLEQPCRLLHLGHVGSFIRCREVHHYGRLCCRRVLLLCRSCWLGCRLLTAVRCRRRLAARHRDFQATRQLLAAPCARLRRCAVHEGLKQQFRYGLAAGGRRRQLQGDPAPAPRICMAANRAWDASGRRGAGPSRRERREPFGRLGH